MAKRRTTYTAEYKLEAIKLVTEKGYSFAEAARQLGISENLLRSWKKVHDAKGAQAFPGKGQRDALEDELHRLREENKRLRMEQDILKKAAAYFAVHCT
jgi:transposase